jgi:hypothetical protein
MRLKVFLIFAIAAFLQFFDGSSGYEACGDRGGVGGLVLGGKKVKRGDWPWIVAIIRKPNNAFMCGGSLISDKHILSGIFYIIVLIIVSILFLHSCDVFPTKKQANAIKAERNYCQARETFFK